VYCKNLFVLKIFIEHAEKSPTLILTRTKTSIRYAKENDREKRERRRERRRESERESKILVKSSKPRNKA
jgi:hypothetical protein